MGWADDLTDLNASLHDEFDRPLTLIKSDLQEFDINGILDEFVSGLDNMSTFGDITIESLKLTLARVDGMVMPEDGDTIVDRGVSYLVRGSPLVVDNAENYVFNLSGGVHE